MTVRWTIGWAMLVAAALAGCAEKADELPPVGTTPGNLAPPLTGVDAEGEEFQLQRGAEEQLIVFYRSGGCSLCLLRLEELDASLASYQALGVEVVAATTDGPAAVAATAERLAPGFPLVSVEPTTAAAWREVPADTAAVAPLVAIYLLDERGVVVHRRISAVAGDRVADAELLTLLEQRRKAE